MIYGLFGVNGSGKTMTLVHELTKYDIVFTNFNYSGIDTQLVVFDPNTQTLFYKMMALVKHFTVPYIVKNHIKLALGIDEAGITFPARQFKAMSSEEAYLFSQHRKLGGLDFWYTSQNIYMVDRILRLNTAVSGYPFHFFGLFFCKWYMGLKKNKESFMYTTMFVLNKKLAKLYNTYEEVGSSKFYFSDPKDKIDVVNYLKDIDSNLKHIRNKRLVK